MVLEAILAKAAELCGGQAGSISLVDGDTSTFAASHGPAMEPYVGTTVEAGILPIDRVSWSGTVIHADDFAEVARGVPYLEQMVEVAGVHSYAAAPLTVDGDRLGLLHMYPPRGRSVRRVRDGHARRLRRPGVPGHRQRPALQRPRRVAGPAAGDDRRPRRRQHGPRRPPAGVRRPGSPRRPPVRRHRGGGGDPRGRRARGHRRVPAPSRWRAEDERGRSTTRACSGPRRSTGEVIHIRDWDAEDPGRYPASASRARRRRSALTIPMIRDDEVIGVVGFSRAEPGGYTDAEVALLKTFVDQAAIAVDNARLLTGDRGSATPSCRSRSSCRRPPARCCSSSAPTRATSPAVFEGIVAQAARAVRRRRIASVLLPRG